MVVATLLVLPARRRCRPMTPLLRAAACCRGSANAISPAHLAV